MRGAKRLGRPWLAVVVVTAVLVSPGIGAKVAFFSGEKGGPPAMARGDRRLQVTTSSPRGPSTTYETVPSLNWTELAANGIRPSNRSFASLAFDPSSNQLVLFGGARGTGLSAPLGDTWVLSGGTWTELCGGGAGEPGCGSPPPPDDQVPMTWDPATHSLLLVNSSGKTWSFRNDTWAEIDPNQTVSTGRGAVMSYDPYDGETVLYSPNESAYWGSTFVFSNGSWTQIVDPTSLGPLARIDEAFFFDNLSNELVLFGGIKPAGCGCFNDTWTFQANRWTELSPDQSPPGGQAEGDYDPVFQYGAVYTPGPLVAWNETWVFDNGNWTNETESLAAAPPQRVGATMAYDPALGYSLSFGGIWVEPDNQTWALSDPLTATVTVTPSTIDLGQSLFINVTAVGGGEPYQLTFSQVPLGCSPPPTPFGFSCVPIKTGIAAFVAVLQGSIGGNVTCASRAVVVSDPGAVVEVVPNPSTVGIPVAFSATPNGGTSPYVGAWSFGDGNSTGTMNAVHEYAQSGSFRSTLVLHDSLGASFSENVTVHVNPLPIIEGTSNVTQTDVGMPIAFYAQATGGTGPLGFQWYFGDGDVSAMQNATHTFLMSGSFGATVVASDVLGVTANATVVVLVSPDPVQTTSLSPTNASVGELVAFNSTVSGGTAPYNFTWNLGDGTRAYSEDPFHAYSAVGIFFIELTVRDGAGFELHSNLSIDVRALSTGPSGNGTSGVPWLGMPLVWFTFGGLVVASVGAVGLAWVLRARRRRARPSQASGEIDEAENP
jgi:hypothetical protein